MGIERARVVEVHPQAATGRVCSGYLIGDHLVLTAGMPGTVDVRPASTAVWCTASRVWADASGEVAIREIGEESAVIAPPGGLRWGGVSGRAPVAVTALGFPAAQGRPSHFREAEQFFGRLVPQGGSGTGGTLPVEASDASRVSGDGLNGAALFAGGDIVGVLVADPGSTRLRARPVSVLAADPSFVEWVSVTGRLELSSVSTPAFGLPIL